MTESGQNENENVIVVKEQSNLTLQSEIANSTQNVYTSITGATLEDRKKIYNAMGKCDYRVSDKLDTDIYLSDVILQKYQVANEETGEVTDKYRTILIDKDGVTYASASTGLFNSLTRLFAILGEPNTWTTPLLIQVCETTMKNGGKTYTIKTL